MADLRIPAGAGLAFREGNILIFLFFYLGALLRRDRFVWALVVSGLIGLTFRPLLSWYFFGDPMMFKESHNQFGLVHLPDTILFYIVGLTLLIPAGLVAALSYRGRRWPELVITTIAFFIFYVLYGYSGIQSGFAKRIILGLPFMFPLPPILLFCLAKVVPDWWEWLCDRFGATRLRPVVAAGMVAWIAGLCVIAVGVNAFVHDQSAPHARVKHAIADNYDSDAVLITDFNAIKKFLALSEIRWLPLMTEQIIPDEVATIIAGHPEFYLVLLYRDESELWPRDAERNDAFVAMMGDRASLAFDKRLGSHEELRIWRVKGSPSS